MLGGAPFNVAWHLQGFNEHPQLISAIGKDALGQTIQSALDSWGLSQQYIQIDPNHPTGVVNVTFSDHEPCYEIQEDCAYDFIALDQLPQMSEAAMIYHGSLAMRNPVSAASLQKLTEDRHHRFFIDVNLRPPWWQLEQVLESLNFAYCVKLNRHELQQLTQRDEAGFYQEISPDHPAWFDIALEFIEQHNLVNLVVTQGEEGACWFTARGDRYRESAPPRSENFVDVVGAGDAFTAICILGMLNDWETALTLQRAQDFASFIVTQRGAICSDASIYCDFKKLWGIL